MIISLPSWLPDLPDHQNPGLLTALNCISIGPDDYGPFSEMSVYSDPLSGGRCQGAFTARDSTGNISIFAGTGSTLEMLTSGSTAWTDVSQAGGYTTATDAQWSFCQYGDRVIATNGADPIQSYVLGVSTDFADLSSDAPIASFVAVVKEFIMAGRVSGSPSRIHWSAQGDPTTWPTPGSAAAAAAQSDFQDLFEGDGGWVQGLISGLESADVVVVQERQFYRGIYVGPPFIFQFKPTESVRGTPAPGSINKYGALIDYLGEDGKYLYDGTTSSSTGANKFDKTFFTDVDQTYLNNISSTVDPIFKIFYMAYPNGSANNGVPNRLLSWNWSTQRATIIEIADGIEFIFRAGTFGYNSDNADGLGWNVDTAPFGPDSRFWTGGRSILAGFNADHELCFFSGDALEATIETGDLDLGEGRMIQVMGTRPVSDVSTQTDITTEIGYRMTQGGTVAYTSATSPANDGFCPAHISARFVRARFKIAAGATWTHFRAFEPRVRKLGQL
jgi:hypothetical protein